MLLLDSAVVLWVVIDSPRLGPRARARIESAGAVYFSSVTLAELTIKQLNGKLELPDAFAAALVDAGLRELPLTGAHTSALPRFPSLARRDPFDRLLLAQAAAEGMALLTSDRTLLASGGDVVADATA